MARHSCCLQTTGTIQVKAYASTHGGDSGRFRARQVYRSGVTLTLLAQLNWNLILHHRLNKKSPWLEPDVLI